MQLSVRGFMIMSLLLVNNISFFTQSLPILLSETSLGSTVFVRQSNFLTSSTSGIQLDQEDKALIEKIIELYNVSHNALVDFTCPDVAIGLVRCASLPNGSEIVPHISLSLHWKRLPYKQKEFILAHEMAHFVLGHIIAPSDNLITKYKIHRDITTYLGGFSLFCILEAIRYYILEPNGWIVIPFWVNGLYASMLVMGLKISQAREKEADIKAITMLGDAQGGIEWLTDMFNKAQYGEKFCADTFGLSSHPSHYARICHLQEWQAAQGK